MKAFDCLQLSGILVTRHSWDLCCIKHGVDEFKNEHGKCIAIYIQNNAEDVCKKGPLPGATKRTPLSMVNGGCWGGFVSIFVLETVEMSPRRTGSFPAALVTGIEETSTFGSWWEIVGSSFAVAANATWLDAPAVGCFVALPFCILSAGDRAKRWRRDSDTVSG
jgi:hypothetical protein